MNFKSNFSVSRDSLLFPSPRNTQKNVLILFCNGCNDGFVIVYSLFISYIWKCFYLIQPNIRKLVWCQCYTHFHLENDSVISYAFFWKKCVLHQIQIIRWYIPHTTTATTFRALQFQPDPGAVYAYKHNHRAIIK